MDTIKILLALTTTVLAAALAWSFSQQKDQSAKAPKDELARIEQQLAALAIEEKNLASEKRLRNLGIDVLSTSRQQQKKDADAQQAVLEKQQREAEEAAKKLRELEAKQSDKDFQNEEQGIVDLKKVEKNNKAFRNSNLILQALPLARVTNYVDNPELGNFVIFDVKVENVVNVDSVLAVRRKDGIAGFVRVTSIEGVEGVADILPGAGKFTPQIGEDLIMDPTR
jgi:hypothetical protein